MSYRTFKRLLGETGLERKCRWILGGGLFVLILASFYVYGYQTEKLVYEQSELTGKLLASRIWLRTHAQALLDEESTFALGEDVENEHVPKYTSRFLRPKTTELAYMPRGEWEEDAFKRLLGTGEERAQANGGEPTSAPVNGATRINKRSNYIKYLGALRLTEDCMSCHPTAHDQELGFGDLRQGDMIAAVSVEMPLDPTTLAINVNRAVLFSFAIMVAIAAMIFAYITVRYVILKPVGHLKEVSEEIAAGNLDIRSDIQSGDEFEELSLAFNRMLRRLVSMQDELRRVNTDLDNKLDELARANMALFEMNRLKSDFLATISHELRTPLNSILGFSDVLAEVSALDPKQKKWIQNIQTSGKTLLALINDILDLAKLEAGKMKVNAEEFSLRDLVENQVQLTQPLADKKNIALNCDVDPAIPIMTQDGPKLQQIVSNLLSNAIKFTPEGGQIGVKCRLDRADAVISVIDNGVGISSEDQRVIFDKFRQADSCLTRNHSGTGLGLSIVRELTKLLGGGEVQLNSELGRGSTFTVRLPVHYVPQSQHELTLGDESLDPARLRPNDVRYFSSETRVRADAG